MAKPTFNRERAAHLLAEAAFFGDKKAAERNGVSKRSLQRYRVRLVEDSELSSLVAEKKKLLTTQWAEELAPAIRGAIDFIRRACDEGNPSDPEMLRSVNGSLKILSDVAQAERILDVRLAAAAGTAATPAGQNPPEAGREVH